MSPITKRAQIYAHNHRHGHGLLDMCSGAAVNAARVEQIGHKAEK